MHLLLENTNSKMTIVKINNERNEQISIFAVMMQNLVVMIWLLHKNRIQ